MPELPEVEVTCRCLRHAGLIGSVIATVETTYMPTKAAKDLHTHLPRQRITALHRRGKYIVFATSGRFYVIIHLGMSGRLWLVPKKDPRSGYERLVCATSSKNELRFHDPRRFGSVEISPTLDALEQKCGIEPLGAHFDRHWLGSVLRSQKRMLQAVLLDQHAIAGIGNIYCNEALWYARLHPQRKSNTLIDKEIAALHQAIRVVLMKGIRYGGTQLGNGATHFRLPSGNSRNTEYLRVYRCAGHPCVRCGSLIVSIRLSGRGTHFCPRCQR